MVCWPKKRAKGDALKAWKALDPDEDLVARIVAAVGPARSSADWRREAGRYIGQVRGSGLFVGIEFVLDRKTKARVPPSARNVDFVIAVRCFCYSPSNTSSHANR